VVSNGAYGVPEGLVNSFPVRADGKGGWEIVAGLEMNAFLKEKLAASVAELQAEREIVKHLVA
jgi:malate dehydrogenase